MRILLATIIVTLTFPAAVAHGQAANVPAKGAAQTAPQASSQPKPAPSQPTAAVPPGASRGPGAAPGTVSTAQAPAVVAPSSLLQPSLKQAQNTLFSLKLDKWKKGSVREEAETNVMSLLHDLQTNIPPLMSAADAAPGEVSQSIPLLKHMDAFYDVLLRVEEASRVSAPGDQINALEGALLGVNKARIALDDHLAEQAAIREKQIVSLESDLRAQKEAAAREPMAESVQATQPCKPAPAPAHRKRKSTSAKTTAPATNTTTANPAAKPSPSTPAPKPQ
ncbi:MAG TPA: hypothetical protein VKB38_16915 [Terracidiphilus sp.]|nr:hypothetical protein [Terracidiphilus sp.]